jgi:hypothetical protein
VVEVQVPDITTYQGLRDMMLLGNFCRLGHILERTFYTGSLTLQELEECEVAQWHYLQFTVWFTRNYVVKLDDHLINPMSIFRRSLIEFMAALLLEKQAMEEQVPTVEKCSSVKLEQQLNKFLKSDDASIFDAFHRLVKSGHKYLDWSGSPFEIRKRNPDDGKSERDDFAKSPLFSSAVSGDNHSNDEDDPEIGNTTGPRKPTAAAAVPGPPAAAVLPSPPAVVAQKRKNTSQQGKHITLSNGRVNDTHPNYCFQGSRRTSRRIPGRPRSSRVVVESSGKDLYTLIQ